MIKWASAGATLREKPDWSQCSIVLSPRHSCPANGGRRTAQAKLSLRTAGLYLPPPLQQEAKWEPSAAGPRRHRAPKEDSRWEQRITLVTLKQNRSPCRLQKQNCIYAVGRMASHLSKCWSKRHLQKSSVVSKNRRCCGKTDIESQKEKRGEMPFGFTSFLTT